MDDTHEANMGSQKPRDIPLFVLKLVNLLQTEEYHQYVDWGEKGESFVVKDRENFSKIVLPHYFKHNKFSSFVRQLNLYGFRKVTNVSHGLLLNDEKDEFRHMFFVKNKLNLLHLIKRKVSLPAGKLGTEIAQVLDEVGEIKDSQSDITKALSDIQRENDDLWREVVSLRQKHAQQQKVVNHLIKFLVSLVQHHGMGRKRRLPIGWKDDLDEAAASPSKITKPTEFHPKSSSAEVSDDFNAAQSSPEGPLITELLSSSASPVNVPADQSKAAASTLNNADDTFDISQLIELDDGPAPSSSVAHPSTAATAVVEPSVYLNFPSSNYNQQPTNAVLTSSEPTPISQIVVNTSIPASYSAPSQNFHRSNSVHEELNLNVDKIEKNLNSIQNRLTRNNEYQLDYDTIQDIFNGQAVLPSQSADWTTDLPKTIPLSQNADNQLVEYTGDNALFNLNTDDDSETRPPDFDDLAALLE